MSIKKVDIYKRDFLNKSRGDARYSYSVDNGYGWVDATFSVADCTRQANLDFGFGDAKDKKARLAKLDKLLNALADFRKILENTEPHVEDK